MQILHRPILYNSTEVVGVRGQFPLAAVDLAGIQGKNFTTSCYRIANGKDRFWVRNIFRHTKESYRSNRHKTKKARDTFADLLFSPYYYLTLKLEGILFTYPVILMKHVNRNSLKASYFL